MSILTFAAVGYSNISWQCIVDVDYQKQYRSVKMIFSLNLATVADVFLSFLCTMMYLPSSSAKECELQQNLANSSRNLWTVIAVR